MGISQVFEVIVNPSPLPPTITQNENTLTSSPANSYQWYFNDTLIPGATEQSYICTQNGQYSVEVANEHGCTSKSNTISITDVGIVETRHAASPLRIYPNPTTGQLTIEYTDGARPVPTMDYTIFNVVGQVVQQGKLTQEISTINIETLAQGMYYLCLNRDFSRIFKISKILY